MAGHDSRSRWGAAIRQSFFSGLVVLAPLAVTIYVLRVLFEAADSLLQPLIRPIVGRHVPGLGITATALLVLAVGFVARSLLVQRLLRLLERQLTQVPLAGTIYGAIKQIISGFAREKDSQPRKVVLVPYPSEGLWAVGFLNGEVTLSDGRVMALVLILNSINPTTGLLALLPADVPVVVDLPVEDAMKLIISGGLANPGVLDLSPTRS